jgi:hypothetical protein
MYTDMKYILKCTTTIPVFFNYITRFEVLIVVFMPSHIVYYMPLFILLFSSVSQELGASVSRVSTKEYVGVL